MKTWLAQQQLLFSQHIADNNLPHAILISGVRGSGKLALANWLIQVLQCQHPIKKDIIEPCLQCKHCNLLAKKSYPDHLHVSSDKNSLGVDHIRQASLFFEKTAQIGSIKTVLIPDAEIMTVPAANALLKTLEEPTDNSVIVLLSSERDTLLPTIISRCRLFDIRPPSGDELISSLEHSTATSNRFSNLSHLAELSNTDVANEFVAFENEFMQYLKNRQQKSIFTKSVIRTEFGLRWLEKITISLMRSNSGWLAQANHAENSSLDIKNDTLWNIYHKITDTMTKIKTLSQANNQFLIEKLIIDIDQILINEYRSIR